MAAVLKDPAGGFACFSLFITHQPRVSLLLTIFQSF